MSITITRTKIIVPRRRADLLSRKRLIAMFDDLLDYKLLLIAAPAGYGKTSLLVDWTHQGDIPVCWYALDSVDQDVHRFINYFIAAISEIFPSFGKQSQAVLQNQKRGELDLDNIVTAIVNDAYEYIKEHFVFVLDDFHTVDCIDDINYFVNNIIEEFDENCHLIISSRTLGSLPNLPLMVGRSMVKGLSFDELAFQPNEIQALINQNYQRLISEDEAAKLELQTEGWITGLLLSAETLWDGMEDRSRLANASGIGLYDYLAQQVLDQQPELIRDFLLKTSLLEEFDADLCEAVFNSPPEGTQWNNLIGEVLQNNLFVLPVENQNTWLRYHHLFRDFLQAKITQTAPDEAKRILQKLADVFSKRFMWEKAYEIYQRIDDKQGVLHLIEKAGTPMLKNGRVVTLEKWLNASSVDNLNTNPSLLSLQGIVNFFYGDVEQGIINLNQAEVIFRDTKNLLPLALTLVRRATGQRFLGNYQKSLADIDETLSILDSIEKSHNIEDIQAEASRIKGLCLYSIGQLDTCVDFLEKAFSIYSFLEDEHNKALLHLDLGLVYMRQGHFSSSLSHYEDALSHWRKTGNIVRQSNLLNNLGVYYHLRGQYTKAGEHLHKALSLAQKSGNTRIESYSLTSLGDIYTDLEVFDAAQESYRQAKEISTRIDNRFLQLYINLAETILGCKLKDFTQAANFLEIAKTFIKEKTSDFEIGLIQLTSGILSLAEGKSAEALPMLIKSLSQFSSGGQPTEIIRNHVALARAHFAQGDRQSSFSHLDQAITIGNNQENAHTLIIASRDAKELIEHARASSKLAYSSTQIQAQVAKFEKKIPIWRRELRQLDFKGNIKQHAKLNIITLGTTQISISAKPVTVPEWSNQKTVRELFFLLLANPKGLSKETIGLHFWPDSTPRQLKTQFKNALYRLRRALGKDVILFNEHEDIYHFNRTQDYEYDVESFFNFINQGENATSQEDKIASFHAAINIYGGVYLPDIDNSWIDLAREQYSQAFLKLELTLAKYSLDTGDPETALTQCHNILQDDSCSEEAHRLAMQAHSALGNQANLVRQFEICKNSLDHELGVMPSSHTEKLYKKLIKQN
ncbi:MAG: tetratricopeptide repeat protein [Chloroflexota bacterium]